MASLPIIPILFTTFNRTKCAIDTMESMLVNLKYERSFKKLTYYVADGGSTKEHYDMVLRMAQVTHLMGSHNIYQSAGANWNVGIEAIFDGGSEIYMRLEDDFVLKHKLDIKPYVNLLMRNEDIGMVRLGLMPINLDLKSFGREDQIYFDVQKTRQYVYSGHPCLIHKRFHDAYGFYPIDLSPGDTEVAFDDVVRRNEGPKIIFPMTVCGRNTYGVFRHIGTEKSI